MVDITVVSDMHVDVNRNVEFTLDTNTDILIVAGDTANSVEKAFPFFHDVSKNFKHIITVDGNHDHWCTRDYDRSITDNLSLYLNDLPDNVHLLGHHQPMIELGGIIFIGCNGWYSGDCTGNPDTNKLFWRNEYSDCRNINFDPLEEPWVLAERDADLVRKELTKIKDTSKPVIVVTHTLPHRSLLRTDNTAFNTMNPFFCNMHMQDILESDLAKNVTAWVYGHTHTRSEKIINGVYTMTNPFGSLQENPSWFPATFPVIM